MNVRIVSGYIPIPGHWRGPDFYEPLMARLRDVPLPLTIYRGSLEDTFLWSEIQKLDFAPVASGGYGPKDTIAYHCVTHAKTAWLAQAALDHPDADVLVWLDVGIFYLADITTDGICRFAERVDDRAIYAPGLLEADWGVGPSGPCWRFAGTLLSVPRRLAGRFDAKCRRIALSQIMESRQVEWEINTWARAEMEAEDDMPIVWYKASHNGSMLHLPERT